MNISKMTPFLGGIIDTSRWSNFLPQCLEMKIQAGTDVVKKLINVYFSF